MSALAKFIRYVVVVELGNSIPFKDGFKMLANVINENIFSKSAAINSNKKIAIIYRLFYLIFFIQHTDVAHRVKWFI